MKNCETLFRYGVLFLLVSILAVQCLVLKETHDARPPTSGEIRKAQGDARRELMLRCPLVEVRGTVSID